MKHPQNWQRCAPFVDALIARGYVRREGSGLHLCMAPGVYLYMYELWQDARGSTPPPTTEDPKR